MTVDGGSRSYVQLLTRSIADAIRTNLPVRSVRRTGGGVEILASDGEPRRFDHVVIASHADQALAMLADPGPEEAHLLGAFGYTANRAVLHTDGRLMPKRRSIWSSWNYLASGRGGSRPPSVSYWMNRLQGISDATPRFLSLNPAREPAGSLWSGVYHHPRFDAAALAAQGRLWSLQGQRNTWFCGSYFGAGFHEDGLQAGLAVAEALGGVRRPWTVEGESGRIAVKPLAGAGWAFAS